MADEANGANGAAEAQTAEVPQFRLQTLAQFVSDLSFENILVRGGITGEVQPKVVVKVGVDAKKRGENQYEVTCKYNVTSSNQNDDKPLYVVELEYGGLFQIENVPDDQIHPFLFIECPRILFPFARRIISDVTRDGGFPQLNIDNVDFVQLYRQRLMQRQARAAQQASEEPAN